MLDIYKLMIYPDKYIKQYVKNTKDIYQLRYPLRDIRFSHQSFEYLLDIILETIERGKRFRVLECLTVLKYILYDREESEIDKNITAKLFLLFQHYIFSPREEVQQLVNNLIRNHLLEHEQIVWLLEHYQESPHILNRILRYPGISDQIFNWAKEIYQRRNIPDRTAEILGILITDTFPEFHKDEDSNTILWGIYYSRNLPEKKCELMLNIANADNIDYCMTSVFTIASRLQKISLIEEILQKYAPD